MESERATWLYSVFPPIVMGLIKHPDFASRDLSHVRGLLNVAPPDTLRLIQDAFAPAVQVGGHFGMTECAGAITCNEWDASLEDRVEHLRRGPAGHRGPRRRAARRAGPIGAGRARRASDPGLRAVRGLLQGPREDRGHVRRRWLAALR